jgi:hypothetical protein
VDLAPGFDLAPDVTFAVEPDPASMPPWDRETSADVVRQAEMLGNYFVAAVVTTAGFEWRFRSDLGPSWSGKPKVRWKARGIKVVRPTD